MKSWGEEDQPSLVNKRRHSVQWLVCLLSHDHTCFLCILLWQKVYSGCVRYFALNSYVLFSWFAFRLSFLLTLCCCPRFLASSSRSCMIVLFKTVSNLCWCWHLEINVRDRERQCKALEVQLAELDDLRHADIELKKTQSKLERYEWISSLILLSVHFLCVEWVTAAQTLSTRTWKALRLTKSWRDIFHLQYWHCTSGSLKVHSKFLCLFFLVAGLWSVWKQQVTWRVTRSSCNLIWMWHVLRKLPWKER